MRTFKSIVGAPGLVVALVLGVGSALADDTLKVVIGQINNWENQAPTLGQDAGIFKKHGIVLENTGTQGAGETIQAVISGSADIGAGVGAAGVMRAFSKGAPVRILAPAFTGTGDLFWYVKADSKISEPERRYTGDDHRLFDEWLQFEQHCRRFRHGARREGEADSDWGAGCDAYGGDVRPGRHRLGRAAVRFAGNQGRQNSYRRKGQRCAFAARTDGAHADRQC